MTCPPVRVSGSVSAVEAKAATDDEARRAETEEADDLRALTEVEKRQDDPDAA